MLVLVASIFAGIIGWGGMLKAVEVNLSNFTLDIHGFLSQGYLKSDHNNFLAETEKGTFEFREYAVNASSYLTDQLRVGAQLFGRNFGYYGNDKIILDWGFADYRFHDWFGIQAGRMKATFGLYNETRDVDLVRTTIFLPESIYNDAWRDSFSTVDGVGAYGTVLLDRFGSLSYQFQWGRIQLEPDSGVSLYLTEFVPVKMHGAEASDLYAAVVELVPAGPLDGLRLRWTWSVFEMDHEATAIPHLFWQAQGLPSGLPITYHGDLRIITLSGEYRWGDLVLAAEMFVPDNFDYEMTSPLLGTLDSGASDIVGYYASAAYRFTEWLELGMFYSEYYNNVDDKDGLQHNAITGNPPYNAWLKDAAMTTRFDFFENWVIKLEGHKMNGTDIMLTVDNPDGTHENWFLFGAKVTYNF